MVGWVVEFMLSMYKVLVQSQRTSVKKKKECRKKFITTIICFSYTI